MDITACTDKNRLFVMINTLFCSRGEQIPDQETASITRCGARREYGFVCWLRGGREEVRAGADVKKGIMGF